MHEVQSEPLREGKPVQFSVLRVPFFLEPDYETSEVFEETNRARLVRNGPQVLRRLSLSARFVIALPEKLPPWPKRAGGVRVRRG